MKKESFKLFVDKTISELKLYAELHFGNDLPNDFEFCWVNNEKTIIRGKNNLIEEICSKIYLSENEIYPCVDLVVEKVTLNNFLFIKGRIAGYKPREFGKGWSNRIGPFIYGIHESLINKKIKTNSKEFKNTLIKKGLIHYNLE